MGTSEVPEQIKKEVDALMVILREAADFINSKVNEDRRWFPKNDKEAIELFHWYTRLFWDRAKFRPSTTREDYTNVLAALYKPFVRSAMAGDGYLVDTLEEISGWMCYKFQGEMPKGVLFTLNTPDRDVVWIPAKEIEKTEIARSVIPTVSKKHKETLSEYLQKLIDQIAEQPPNKE